MSRHIAQEPGHHGYSPANPYPYPGHYSQQPSPAYDNQYAQENPNVQQYEDYTYQQGYNHVEQNDWQNQAYIEQGMSNLSFNQAPQTTVQEPQYPKEEQQYYGDWQGQSAASNVTPCDPRFISVSVAAFPSTSAMRVNSSLPFTITTQPLAEVYFDPSLLNSQEQGPLPCVNFGNAGVVRCKACRAYINPYCKFIDGGSRWRCCICGRPNDVHNDYFCDIDPQGERADKHNRIELSMSSYEIVAPAEYMVRPPQPPAFVFVIDVSLRSREIGLLATVCETIQGLLDYLPGLPRTKIAIITFDSLVHMYSLRSTLSRPQMMVLPNLEDLFLPFPEDYLVDLDESRSLIEVLLQTLPSMHANTRNVESALGAATMTAFRIVNAVGGKVLFFTTSLPSLGPARLKNRDTSSSTELKLLQPATDFYKSWGLKYARMQVRADIFLFPNQYCDVATIVGLSQFSGGQLYTYPQYSEAGSSNCLRADLTRCLTREQSWEAVIRVRVSKGAKIVGYEGNFFLRGTDLLSVPNCSADDTYLIEIGHDETPPNGAVIIQVALLYTTSFGERRIRVHNSVLPVVEKLEDIFYYIDLASVINGIAKKALSLCVGTSMQKGREFIQNTCIAVLSAFRKSCGGYRSVQLSREEDYPDCLRYLPLMTLALLKCSAFKESNAITSDARCIAFSNIRSMSPQTLDLFLRPRFYPVHQFSGLEGIPDENGTVLLPLEINATSADMYEDGAYLADNGSTLFFWLGRLISSTFLQSCFGISTLHKVDPNSMQLIPLRSDDTSSILFRLHNVIAYLRSQSIVCQRLQVVCQPVSESKSSAYDDFTSCLILDRTSAVMSYSEFLSHIAKSTS
uniref:Uncharacterized protein n=1 Tax=Spongospora subterranea TaxID=70186 RepID=A0A0H5RLR6_9EUKA|eukprot:CRZ09674.1 hypothetical protein [Spongospora subterranea]